MTLRIIGTGITRLLLCHRLFPTSYIKIFKLSFLLSQEMLIKANDLTIFTLREDMKRIWKQCWRSRWTMHELKLTIIDSWQDINLSHPLIERCCIFPNNVCDLKMKQQMILIKSLNPGNKRRNRSGTNKDS